MHYTLHPKFVRLVQLIGYALFVAILLVLGIGTYLANYRVGLLEQRLAVPVKTAIKAVPTVAPTATPSATLAPKKVFFYKPAPTVGVSAK